MSGETVEVKIEANASKLKGGMEDASASVKKNVEKIKHSLDTVKETFEKVTGALALFTAALAGGEAFGEIISSTNKFIASQENLMNQLGVSGEKAAGLTSALDRTGVSTETYLAVQTRLTMHIKTNEKAFSELGIKVRDASGQLLNGNDVMQNTLTKLQDFKAGTDRNTVAIELMGRGYTQAAQLLKLQGINMDEAGEHMRSLGLVVTDENIKMRDSYNSSMAEAKDTMESLGKVIGENLIPILTRIANWVAESGVPLFRKFSQEMTSLGSIINSLLDILEALWDTVSTVFSSIGDLISAIFGSAGSAVTDFNYFGSALLFVGDTVTLVKMVIVEALNVIIGVINLTVATVKMFADVVRAALTFNWDNVQAAWKNGMDSISATVTKATDRIAAEAAKSKKSMDDLATSLMSTTQLSGHIASPKAGTMNAPSSFKQEKAGKKEKVDNSADEEKIAHIKQMSEIEIQTEAETIKQKKSMGQISAEQELSLMQALEERKYVIEQQALESKLAIKNQEPIAIQKLNDEIEALASKHALEIIKINDQIEVAKKKALEATAAAEKKANEATLKQYQSMMAPINSAVNTSIMGVIQGTNTMQRALANIGQSILGEFISMGVKSVTEWVANEAAKTTATILGAETRATAEGTAGTEGLAMSAALTVKAIMGDAAKAFSGVWAALSGVPVVGPAMAAAEAPSAMAGVMAVVSSVPHSSGGDWQIPADRLNFIHKKETILPADKSAGLDNLIKGGGGNGATHLHIHAIDASGVKQFFDRHGSKIMDSVAKQTRNFSYGQSNGFAT